MVNKDKITFKHIAIDGIPKSGKTKLANLLAQKIGGKVVFDRIERDLFEERIICDYLLEKDKIYAYQTLTDDELVIYERIYSILSERVSKPDLAIYLQISLQSLLKRIAKEGSALEKNISEKYLQDILEAFDYFFFNYEATPLLVIKVDDLDFSREEDIMDIADKIKEMKKSPLYYVPLSRTNKESKEDK